MMMMIKIIIMIMIMAIMMVMMIMKQNDDQIQYLDTKPIASVCPRQPVSIFAVSKYL